jgi:hypothetical protein
MHLGARASPQYFSYIVEVIFNGGGNRSTGENNIDLSQVTDKLYRVHLA